MTTDIKNETPKPVGSGDWLGMDTAPRDGSRILVATHREQHELAYFDHDKYAKKPKPFWRTSGPWGLHSMRNSPPVAWQPLPPLPNVKDQPRGTL